MCPSPQIMGEPLNMVAMLLVVARWWVSEIVSFTPKLFVFYDHLGDASNWVRLNQHMCGENVLLKAMLSLCCSPAPK